MKSQLKVLFLTRYPYEGASSRYRVYQYFPYLESLGVRCTCQSFMNSEMYKLYFSSGNIVRKSWHFLRAMLRRLDVLRHYRDYDIIYMQRELFPIGPPLIERYLRRRSAILLLITMTRFS